MESISSKLFLLENQLVDLDVKKIKMWQYKGESRSVKLTDNYKYNVNHLNKDKYEIIDENENLLIDKAFIFNNCEILDKKQEKILIENFLVYPNCCVGQVFSTFKTAKKNKIIIGTGTLIGPNIVLTSASNIFRKELGNPDDIMFIPLVTKEATPNKIKVTKSFFKDSFKYDSDFFCDYAILILETEIGNELGFLGTQVWTEMNKFPDSQLIGFTNDFKNTYEVGKNSFYNFPFLLDLKLDYFSSFLRYNADSNSGQSGSSIFYLDKNTHEYTIIGLHLGKIKNNFTPVIDNKTTNNVNMHKKNSKPFNINNHDLNIGILFDESFRDQIIEWIESYNISINNLPIFKKLNLGWKNLNDEDVDVLPRLNTLCIKELYFNNNNFTDESFKLLVKSKFDNLNVLNFKSNKLEFGCLKEIDFPFNFTSLNALFLSENQINDEGFLQILKKFVFGKLLILDLSSNFIVGEILKEIEGYVKFPYLEKLDISDNKINKEGKSLLESKITIEKGALIFSHGIKSPKKIKK